jgi:hypothetical protein
VEDDDYSMDVSSAHVPAALLKKWLRDLVEPIITDSLYDSCIDLGQKVF